MNRRGTMNPAGKERCNMREQIELEKGDCNFSRTRGKCDSQSVGPFISAQYLTGLRIDHMDLPAS